MTDAAGALAIAPQPVMWEQVKTLVVASGSSPDSKRAYARALEALALWAREEGSRGAGKRRLREGARAALARRSTRKASRLPRSTSL